MGARWFSGNDLGGNTTADYNHSSQFGRENAPVVGQSVGIRRDVPCNGSLAQETDARGATTLDEIAGTGLYRRDQHETWEERRNQLRLYDRFLLDDHFQVSRHVLVQLYRDCELAHGFQWFVQLDLAPVDVESLLG